ncbi:hypothetical protein C8R44DRAFT_883046 [Mycena epipterygia]|nr:hypothetical protein C8R44DRAFT_883046 [Mycena epipterygia]
MLRVVTQTTSNSLRAGHRRLCASSNYGFLSEQDRENLLRTGFFDVILDTLTVCIRNGDGLGDVELLTGALLPGLNPLLVFQFLDFSQIELRDGAGNIRRFECWNEDSCFELQDVWTHWSLHYNLHKTVREILIQNSDWDGYVEIFELYPPPWQAGITLALQLDWNDEASWNNEHDSPQTPRIMRIAGLTKVEFFGRYTGLVPEF